ncbi:SPFH domain-containing protein [Treponema pedis]|uniref:SPFH domain-containing protein n=1 Tax=Treponema pedis TaxID=409322 RepID=A0A7S6WNQ4_9SPIR|nr:SPFH domain-containing protein [Treponema pedis]QOW60528.1 SPFH domain-containing protein [Treponema pedis]
MGLIAAALGAAGGGLADQWLEVIEADEMGEGIVLAKGVPVRTDKRNTNKKGSSDIISNGSIIHVNQNQFMMLVDGGKIVDYSAEPGYFKVENSSAPSLFGGQFGEAIKETFSRFKFGGTAPSKQEVFYINLQEIKGIKFGTPNPLQYFDNFYNAELFLRAFGNYSIKITDPIKFFKEACPRDAVNLHIDEINEQYLTEFLEALQAAISQMSMEGERISFLPSKGTLLSKHMAQILDDSWKELRGMEVLAVGIASISYDDESKELINMRNKGAMLGDPSVREGFVQGSVARGMEAAGSNPAGAGMAFMGMGMGMNAAGSFMGQASQTNMQQMQQRQDVQRTAGEKQAGEWFCSECGTKNGGKFCSNCGQPKPAGSGCPNCGAEIKPGAKFCPECGTKLQ